MRESQIASGAGTPSVSDVIATSHFKGPLDWP